MMVKIYKTLAFALVLGAISTPTWGDFWVYKDNTVTPVTDDFDAIKENYRGYKVYEYTGEPREFKITEDLSPITEEIKEEYISSPKHYIFYKE